MEERRRHDLLGCVNTDEARANVWSSFVMSTKWAAASEDVVRKVEELANTPHVSADFATNIRDIQDALSTPNIVSNMATHHIGRYLTKLQDTSELSRSDLLRELGNAAETLRAVEYQVIRSRCAEDGCGNCSEAQKWEDEAESSRSPQRPIPCRSTQVLSKLLESKYINLNPTYFNQCLTMSQNVPQNCPLVFSPEPPSELRQFAGQCLDGLKQATKMRYSTLATGLHPMFKVPSAMDAIHYTDGDGGTVSVDAVPGFRDYLEGNHFLDLLEAESVNGPQVPFREANHDAIELGHRYTVRDLMDDNRVTCDQPFGYRALVEARKFLANSEETVIVPLGKDLRGGRLLLEVFTKDSGDQAIHGEEMSVRLIQAGLSFPTDNAATHCKRAKTHAKAARKGIWEAGECMEDQSLKPWTLKRQLTTPNTNATAVIDQCEITVSNSSTFLNEAHVFVAKSTIPGAERGLFLRPGTYVIPMNRRVCSYQEEYDDEVDPSLTSDYLFEVSGRGRTFYYQAARYDGQNIGRFINQGGLQEGLQEMCLKSNKDTGCQSFSPRDVKAVFERHCNVKYNRRGRELEIIASKDLHADPTKATELFGNYGQTYWTKYVIGKYQELDHNDFLAKSVLWCLLSEKSCWSAHERAGAEDITHDVRDKFRKMTCPYTAQGRRR